MLEEMGFLIRTHGGALLAEDHKLEIPLSIRKDTYAVFANASDIDILITDEHFQDEHLLRDLDIEVIKA